MLINRMIGTVFWECICCSARGSRRLKIRSLTSDPGSCSPAMWSFILPSKRRVYIHTVCGKCAFDKGFAFPDEQLNLLWKARGQFYFKEQPPWTSRSWRFWLPGSEFLAIQKTIFQNKELRLNLSVVAGLSWTSENRRHASRNHSVTLYTYICT